MKRGADREMASPQKRPRALGHEVRVLIPSRVAGSVIGKGGQNIARLRTESKATISVPDCQGPERLVSISADEQETTLNVLEQVLQLIQDDQKRGVELEEPGSMEVRALFHHTQVGSIIGKGGSKIKELRETTSAQIKVFGNVCPRSTDRIVSVTGSLEVCMDTIKRLLTLANESPVKGPMEKYDPHNYDEFHAMEYGGFGESRGGGDFFRGPPRGPPPRSFRPSNRGRGDGGPSRGGGLGRGRGFSFAGNGFGGPPPSRHYGGGGVGIGIGGGGGGTGSGGGGSDNDTCQVTIPNEYAGAIIGKGGTRIRRIRADSGAGITIAEPAEGQNDRIITITGSQGQIRMAQYLLQQSVKEHL